jgi:hypothetical protein
MVSKYWFVAMVAAVALYGCQFSSTRGGIAGGGPNPSRPNSDDSGARDTASSTSSGFEKRAFYSITAEVGGQRLALTFIPPEGPDITTVSNNASKAKVVLEPANASDKRQMWNFKDEGSNGFKLFAKIKDEGAENGGILRLYKTNGEFSGDDDEEFHAKYNRVTVGIHQDDSEAFWQVVRQPDGTYRFGSDIGVKEHLRKKGDAPSYGWFEERVLEAWKAPDGRVLLRHRPPSSAAGQRWTITKVGY